MDRRGLFWRSGDHSRLARPLLARPNLSRQARPRTHLPIAGAYFGEAASSFFNSLCLDNLVRALPLSQPRCAHIQSLHLRILGWDGPGVLFRAPSRPVVAYRPIVELASQDDWMPFLHCRRVVSRRTKSHQLGEPEYTKLQTQRRGV